LNTDVFDGVDQPLRPGVQPGDRLVGIGRWLAAVDCIARSV
jgi:hypothetical protein